MNKITKVNILGRPYSIDYKDKASDVDSEGRHSLWGQTDFWTNSIRVFEKGRPKEEIFQTIVHEILHVITTELKMNTILNSSDKEEIIDLLATGLVEMLLSNKWIDLDFENESMENE